MAGTRTSAPLRQKPRSLRWCMGTPVSLCTCFIDGRFTGLGTASFTPPSVLGRCACMQKIHELGSPVWQGRSQHSSASSAAHRRLLLVSHAARTLLSSRTPPFVRVAPPGAPTGFEPSAAFKLRFAYFWLLLGGCDILCGMHHHAKLLRSTGPPIHTGNTHTYSHIHFPQPVFMQCMPCTCKGATRPMSGLPE